MRSFELNQMILQGWPVLTVLLVMSILSVTVIVDRVLALRRARLDARHFIGKVNQILRDESPAAAHAYCSKFSQPLASVAAAVIARGGDREAREREMQHTLEGEIHALETYVPILGTIASSAPFVGLLGTVIGIIRAFADIAMNVGGGPEVVAAGIAEALVTTAGGLLVAIPALIGYNYLVRRVQRVAQEVELAVYDLMTALPEA